MLNSVNFKADTASDLWKNIIPRSESLSEKEIQINVHVVNVCAAGENRAIMHDG